jgi:hypothetical protein
LEICVFYVVRVEKYFVFDFIAVSKRDFNLTMVKLKTVQVTKLPL